MKKIDGFLVVIFLAIYGLFLSFTYAEEKKSDNPVEIRVKLSTKGSDISFDQTAIQVQFGKKIRLTYINQADADSDIIHNVAILKQGKEAELIKSLHDNFYNIEKVDQTMILVRTKNLHPGESETVTFTPNKMGYYTYLCLMPGHGDMLGMKGVLNVVKASK